MERLEKTKGMLCREIHEVGKSVVEKMEKLKIDDIIIVCSEPTNYSLKGEDMKGVDNG